MRRNLNIAPFYIFMVISVVLVGVQLVNIQFVNKAQWEAAAIRNRSREVYSNPSRGVLYDRNGLQLVANQPQQAIAVTEANLPDGTDFYILPYQLPAPGPALEALYSEMAAALARDGHTRTEIVKTIAAADPTRPYHPLLVASRLSDAAERDITRAIYLARENGKPTPYLLLDERERVWRDLSQLTNAPTVVYLIPYDLPTSGKGDERAADEPARQTLYRDLSAILGGQPPAEEIAARVQNRTKAIDRPIMVARNVSDIDALEVRLNARKLAGVFIGSELEFNYRMNTQNDGLRPVVVLSNIATQMVVRVSEQSSRLPGVSIIAEPSRQYTQGSLYGHLLGYVGLVTEEDINNNPPPPIDPSHPDAPVPPVYEADDKNGKAGLERSLEVELRGTKGVRGVEVDASGHVATVIGATQPQDGNNIYLTLDTKLQQKVREYLQAQLTRAGVTTGAAVVQDVRSGAVLAMVSLPDYDNNLFAQGISKADFDTLITKPDKPLLNRAINPQPPGSTFKVIMASAGLQEQVVTTQTTFFCPPYIRVPTTQDNRKFQTYRDWRAAGFGNINIITALGQSSDVFFYQLGSPDQTDPDSGIRTRWLPPNSNIEQYFQGLGINRIASYARAFGLGAQTGIELPDEEAAGNVPDPVWKERRFPGDFWSLGDTIITSIGQGYMTATPLQINNMTAAVANGGTLYRPTLVYEIKSGDNKEVMRPFKPDVIRQLPISPDNLAFVRQGMRLAVTGIPPQFPTGTAWRVNYASFPIAGKTGTAEYGLPNEKGVRKSHAWFTAYAPFDNPQIAVTVFIEGDTGITTQNNTISALEGSQYAVPAVGNIISYYFNLDEWPKN